MASNSNAGTLADGRADGLSSTVLRLWAKPVLLSQRADAARGCGLVTDSSDATAQELGKWSIERGAQMEQAAAAQKEWANLQVLLNGRSLEQSHKEAASSAEVHGIGYVRIQEETPCASVC